MTIKERIEEGKMRLCALISRSCMRVYVYALDHDMVGDVTDEMLEKRLKQVKDLKKLMSELIKESGEKAIDSTFWIADIWMIKTYSELMRVQRAIGDYANRHLILLDV